MLFPKMQKASNFLSMQRYELLMTLLIPLPVILSGVLCRFLPHLAARLSTFLAWLSCLIAWAVALSGTMPSSVLFRIDHLTSVMICLVSFLGAVVIRFASRYLEGDAKQATFLSWMSFTLSSVLTMVMVNHLLLLTATWWTTNWCLNRLLLHHPERPAAVFAARKKFVFSRVAESLLLLAAIWLYQGHGTWRIDELAMSIQQGNFASLPEAAILLGICAMLRSAQFPFHSWLPDTMDTPTPVSAFMHAGIINGGGFLVLRMSTVFAAAPASLHLLTIVGAFTAAFGALVMLVQPGVKRALAYSTIAQMGFMMVQCGLGAWGLAVLHLVAHSLYKANAFLHAGSTIGAISRESVRLSVPSLLIGLVLGGGIAVAGVSGLDHFAPHHPPVPVVFHLILALALAYGMARAWSAHRATFFKAVFVSCGVTAMVMVLHVVSEWFVADFAQHVVPTWLMAMVSVVFIGLFLMQAMLWRTSRYGWGQRLYIHALNGFYLGVLANRWLNHLWPNKKSKNL